MLQRWLVAEEACHAGACHIETCCRGGLLWRWLVTEEGLAMEQGMLRIGLSQMDLLQRGLFIEGLVIDGGFLLRRLVTEGLVT